MNRGHLPDHGIFFEKSCSPSRSREVLHPDSVPTVRERMRRRGDGEPVPITFQEQVICKDGSKKWIDFNGSLIQYDGKAAVICVALDITERRQMDEQLRVSQERIRLASESAGISSWEWDIRHNAVIWSPEVYRIFRSPDDRDSGYEL